MYEGAMYDVRRMYEGNEGQRIMTKEELKERYRQFALSIIKLVDGMPESVACWAIARQIIRSGTSPSANYRAACIAKSDKDFLNKLKMVEEEIDETSHWLSLIIDGELMPKARVQSIYEESIELRKITTKAILTTKSKLEAIERDKSYIN